jgi:signal peptidase I
MEEPWASPRPPEPRRGRGRIVFWVITGIAAACLIGPLIAAGVTTRIYTDTSTSMQPAVQSGDRLPVTLGAGINRGDIAVLRIPSAGAGSDDLYVKRVIGLPGDHVACCDASGKVTVNGKALDETYLYPGDQPSRITFSVTLGPGKIWVMGDHRLISRDSREWGPIPQSDVVGPVLIVLHGGSTSSVKTPQTFVSNGLAPSDNRTPAYVWLIAISGAGLVALIVLLVLGVTRTIMRRRASRTPQGVEGW